MFGLTSLLEAKFGFAIIPLSAPILGKKIQAHKQNTKNNSPVPVESLVTYQHTQKVLKL